MSLGEALANAMPVLTTWGAQDKMTTEAFEEGKKLGIEIAIEEAFKNKAKCTATITEEEQKELWDFLIERNLCVTYDVMNGGLMIRRFMSTEKHTKEMVARMTKKAFEDEE